MRLPVPVQAAMLGVEQLFTEMVKAAEVVPVPCLPKVNVGGETQFALFPVCPLLGQRMAVAAPVATPAIVIPRLAVAVCELESVTLTVKEDVPAVVGVPMI